MTVVVAAYEFSSTRRWDFSDVWDADPEGLLDVSTEYPPKPKREITDVKAELANDVPVCAFLIADSVLSSPETPSGRVVAARSEQKVRAVNIQISEPDFTPDGYVTGNHSVARAQTCGITYCGSHFTFGQVFTKFTYEMEQLVFTWNTTLRKYDIVCADDSNALKPRSDQSFDADIDFRSSDLPLLGAEFVVDVFRKCVQATIDDIYGARFRNGHREFGDLRTEFVLAVYCEIAQRPKLFHVDIVDDKSVFPSWFTTSYREIPASEVLVLGKPSWQTSFETSQKDALENNRSIFSALHVECENQVRAVESENYVGGKISCGRADRQGFAYGHLTVY
jgi:hypothetical protein